MELQINIEANNWWKDLPDSRKKAVVGIYLRKPNGYFNKITQDEKNHLYQILKKSYKL